MDKSMEDLQGHVKLEVSLEVIMAKLADAIFDLSKEENKENENSFQYLMKVQEKAYEGNNEIVNKIIKGEI